MEQVTRASELGCRVRRAGRWLAVLTAATCPFGAAVAAQQPSGLTVKTYRFWRPHDITMVETYANVPWRALTFAQAGAQATAHFETTLEVKDAQGTVLATQSWADSVRGAALSSAGMMRASSIEHGTLNLKPGRYVFTMRVKDTASGKVVSGVDTVEAFASEPRHSDLVVAASIASLSADSAAPAAALRRGELVVLPNLEGAVTAEQPNVPLFAELYNSAAQPETAQAVVRITSDAGFHHETPPRVRIVEPGIGVEALAMNLTGLPPGDYELHLEWKYANETAAAGQPIRMLPMGAGEVTLAAPDAYDAMDVAQLDSVFGPLRYVATDDEKAAFDLAKDAGSKRRVLREFWTAHAKAAGEAPAEFKSELEERVQYVNRNFRPPAARNRKKPVQGWQTDRGRIYIMLGAPADKMVSQERGGALTRRWEAWKYAQGRGDIYLFVDVSGFGRYEMLYTTNPYIPSDPSWQNYLGREDLQRLQAF